MECPVTHHRSHGVGEATHLGPFTEDTDVCGFNPRLVVEPPFDVEGGPPYFVADFTVETNWTADNGDQVSLTGGGVLVQTPDGRSALRASVTVDNGTGRFQGASGQLSAVKGIDETGRGLTGWIDYEPPRRPTELLLQVPEGR